MSGTFPDELCGVGHCSATWTGNPDLVAPCGTGSCCDFGERPSCPSTPTTPKPTLLPTTPKPTLLPTPAPTARPTPAPTPAPSFLANDWWKQHFADGKIPSGTNLDAPAGYVAIEGAGPCMCRGSGWNEYSCGKLCCRGSPYTDPDPNGQYYIGKHKNGRICYKPEGAEYKDGDGGNSSGTASLAIIIPVVVAAVLLLAAVLFLVRKRVVAARQHRRESMPTVGNDEAEVQA
jgi:hypothetical protein